MAEAGWYMDPKDANRLRYWDGGRWTASTAGSAEATRRTSAIAPGDTVTTTEPIATRSSGGTVAAAGTPAEAGPAPADADRDRRRRLALVSGAVVVLLAIVAGGVAILGRDSHSKIAPIPHADQAYLSAVHADLPQDTTPDSRLLAFGRLACGTYAQHDSPTQRDRTLDRPDLVSSAASRNQLLGEALNHLCPQFQLSGILPVPAAPGTTRPTPTVTTAPGPSISVSGPNVSGPN